MAFDLFDAAEARRLEDIKIKKIRPPVITAFVMLWLKFFVVKPSSTLFLNGYLES